MRLATSTMCAASAVTNGAAEPSLPSLSRYSVPRLSRNAAASKLSPGPGHTVAITRGEASGLRMMPSVIFVLDTVSGAPRV